DYPAIDQVTYYQRVRGELADFEVNPAFQALSQTVKRFSNCKVRSLVHQPDGLSIFRFESPAGNAFLLCWCRDGMGWPLSTVFTEDSLHQAQFTDALGSQIQRPAVISEHPVYIDLADPTQIPVLPSLMPLATPDIIHLSSPLRQSITDTEGHWQGATMLRARHQLEDIGNIPTLRPSVLPGLPETAVLRDARNRIWNVSDPRNICGEISVKLNRVAGIKRLTYRFRPSKGQRHWNNACEMLRRGIRTPPPVAFYQRTVRAGINDSWYLCEFIPGAFSAKDVYAAFRKGAEEYRGLEKSQWYDIFAGFVCEMHNKQIVHRDLSAGNLLVAQTETGEIEPYLIDIGRAWTGNGSGLNNRHRLQDLMRICYKLDWTDRAHFIRLYQSHMGKNLPGWWRIPLHYYDYKQKFKKGIKRKGKTRHH
ncbi:MAG: lipopolysaccharide kinase InaA family protein, partial [Halioglobus sp.]